MAAPNPGIEQLRQELGAVDARLATRLDGFEARVDQRFGTVDRQLGTINQRFDAIDQRFDAVDQRFDAIDQRFATVDQRFATVDQRFAAVDQRLATVLGHIDATAAETRRHFDVIAESLRSTIRLVADGVAMLDEKVERFRDETRESFERVDRRFLRLEVRVSALERR